MGIEAPPTMDTSTVYSLCDRLSDSSEVEQKLPWSLRSKAEGATHDEKRAHLQGLLERDAALFLEKYGASLSGEELSQFEVLKGDYEVNWHLNRLSGDLSPSPQQEKARAAQVKNRRLAYMQRLEDEGSFFSEDAMRERAPLLHEQFMGRQPTSSEPGGRQPVVPRPGEGLSELVLRQAKEDVIAARLKRERADFEKEAAEESAAATATQNEDRGEVDEEPSTIPPPRIETPPQETPSDPTNTPGLPPPRIDIGGTARAASARKGSKVRFGVISGASVGGTEGATSARMDATSAQVNATSAQTAVGFVSGSGGAGNRAGSAENGNDKKGSELGANEFGENSARPAERSQAGPSPIGEATVGPSNKGAFGTPENGSNPKAGGINTKRPNAASRGVNGRTSVNPDRGNESEEKISHARFGEFTTPEPISASRIASQVVRRVLESATAGPRHLVTRFGEIPERGFGEGLSPAGGSSSAGVSGRQSGATNVGSAGPSNRNAAGLSDKGLAGVSSGGFSDGKATWERREESGAGGAADEGIRDGQRRIGDVGRRIGDAQGRIGDVGRGIGGGARGIGDGARGIGDGGAEEMDTDEDDLGSRTHTDASELEGDLVDVDSRPQGQIAEFRRIMKERFLEGDDKEHVDYRAIDADTKLDDDWLGEVDRDAQEKYFDED